MIKKSIRNWALVSLTLMFGATLNVHAAGGYNIEFERVNNDVRDKESLQRGAVHFVNYCMACHSAELNRYNRVARDLGWTDDEVIAKLTYNTLTPVDMMVTTMEPGVSEDLFGIQAPDLSLMSRLKGNDYIYTFIRGYYQQEDGSWNNSVLEGTSMPNVLEGVRRHSTEAEFDQFTTDLVNFMDYIGEPSKVQRWDLGWKVIAFLLVLLLLTYLLKKEYWRDIKK
ncbi:cytochrome c1 [Thiomicrospira sp. ALE5]|uniref:cytochrome c1 n=1 Tax=Thiomicrospira sp. ALE5 TaxID=748650 RepID=UPI0008EB8BF5|nr:cytochrome c1 [Thiomicrospira sp. ALE5]SFR59694.1 ubiquinol-cytochrome c reductase cytochrome c1 subunit [Thiomicrospira sp. ALE5]